MFHILANSYLTMTFVHETLYIKHCIIKAYCFALAVIAIEIAILSFAFQAVHLVSGAVP